MVFQLGLLGHQISESLSPRLHRHLGRWADIEIQYDLYDTCEASFEDILELMASRRLSGFNVTAPYKSKIMGRLQAIDESAEAVGAINTVLVDASGQWTGANTDVTALQRVLSEHRGRQASVIGAGGAARAACVALQQLGFDDITLINRTLNRARTVAEDLGLPKIVDLAHSASHFPSAELVINTLPPHAHDRLQSLLPTSVISGLPWLDLSYAQAFEPWRIRLSHRGYAVEDGRRMFIYQGLSAFELWTGRRIPFSVGAEAVNYAA